MSVKLWRIIFETATEEEIKHILKETKLSISGFRANSRKDIPRSLMNQTITKEKKWKKIHEEYQKLLELNAEEKFKIDNPLRRKMIQLIIMGDDTSLVEAESLGCQLTLPAESKKNNSVEDLTSNCNEPNIMQDWRKKYKKLESETKKQQQILERKYENKTKQVNELKNKKIILEKNHEQEIGRLKEKFSEIMEERNLDEKRIKEWHETTKILKNVIIKKDEEIQEFIQKTESYEELIKNYSQQLEELLLKSNSGGECIANNSYQEDIKEPIEYPNTKIKILVIGETTYKHEELRNLDVEFIDVKGINMEEFKERRDLATIIIMLSWTLTMSMQRKLKKSIPIDKLNEFYDYTAFREYITKKECINYVFN